MPQTTSIEWTATVNPDGSVTPGMSSNPIYAVNTETGARGWFCTKPSTGCAHCYSEKLNLRFGNKLTYTKGNLSKIRFELDERELDKLRKAKRPKRVFICDMTDLFHEAIPDEMIERVFDAMFGSVHTFQILTKRPARMRDFIRRMLEPGLTDKMLENIWLGVSVENQEAADERIPLLLQTRGMVRWLSIEPLLGPLTFRWAKWQPISKTHANNHLDGLRRIDWAVIGGESGAGARPCELAWMRSIVDECKEAGVPVFVKQLGSRFAVNYYDHEYREEYESHGWDWPEPIDWDTRNGQPPVSSRVRIALKDRKGGDMNEWPEDLRVRAFPTPQNAHGRAA